jgi:glucosamine-6-phosphate deaminase
MKVLIFEAREELGRAAAGLIASAVRENPELVLGLITGETPLECYRELVRMHREEQVDFSQVVTFALDEYLGLSPSHPLTCKSQLMDILLGHLNIRRENLHFLDCNSPNPERACEKYEEEIREAGGIDLQLLGIGLNGHLGLNEPGSPFDSRTRVVELSEVTKGYLSRYFGQEVPQRGMTMGLGTIMEARKILLLAHGSAKAEIVAKALKGPITKEVPASILQRHPACTVMLDKAAASKLL